MAQNIGRNINVNDTAVVSAPIALNTTTSVKISDANTARTVFDVNNNNASHGWWLKLQAAGIDNVKKGIYITNKNGSRPFWSMPRDNIYTGEISAIADTDTPEAFVTEY